MLYVIKKSKKKRKEIKCMKDSFKTMSALVIVKEGSPSLLNEKKKNAEFCLHQCDLDQLVHTWIIHKYSLYSTLT